MLIEQPRFLLSPYPDISTGHQAVTAGIAHSINEALWLHISYNFMFPHVAVTQKLLFPF